MCDGQPHANQSARLPKPYTTRLPHHSGTRCSDPWRQWGPCRCPPAAAVGTLWGMRPNRGVPSVPARSPATPPFACPFSALDGPGESSVTPIMGCRQGVKASTRLALQPRSKGLKKVPVLQGVKS